MQLVPSSWGSAPIVEGNDCHAPAGTPTGGQFCAKGVQVQVHGRGTDAKAGYERPDVRGATAASGHQSKEMLGTLARYGWKSGVHKNTQFDPNDQNQTLKRWKFFVVTPTKTWGAHTKKEANSLWAEQKSRLLEEATLLEFNPYHDAKGRFTHAQGGSGITVGSQPYASPGERDAADGRVFRAAPAAFQAALHKNTRLATLTEYDAATLATFKLFLLKGGQAGYALKPDGELVNLFNSGGQATRGAGAWLVIHAIEQGASHGDHFDGFLTGFYRNLGWKETRREPNWTPGGPAVVYMRFTGDTRERQSARARYRQHRRLDVA